MKGLILHDHEVKQLAATGKVLVVRVIKMPKDAHPEITDVAKKPEYYTACGWGFGPIGTRFFVKEVFYLPVWRTVWYRAEDPNLEVKWKSAATMPQPYSRFTVETEAVEVKRVQDATPEECRLAGEPAKNNDIGVRYGFGQTWDRHNPKHPWAENPWCWYATFKRV